MSFRDFYRSLPRERKECFARLAGTTSRYIEIHLLRDGKKIPQRKLMKGLARACEEFGSGISELSLLAYFYELPASEPTPQGDTTEKIGRLAALEATAQSERPKSNSE